MVIDSNSVVSWVKVDMCLLNCLGDSGSIDIMLEELDISSVYMLFVFIENWLVGEEVLNLYDVFGFEYWYSGIVFVIDEVVSDSFV